MSDEGKIFNITGKDLRGIVEGAIQASHSSQSRKNDRSFIERYQYSILALLVVVAVGTYVHFDGFGRPNDDIDITPSNPVAAAMGESDEAKRDAVYVSRLFDSMATYLESEPPKNKRDVSVIAQSIISYGAIGQDWSFGDKYPELVSYLSKESKRLRDVRDFVSFYRGVASDAREYAE